jgi:hypothetical protein
METFIIFWFGFIVGLSVIVLLYRKRIDTLESEIDTKINLQEGKKKAEAFYSRHETFPEYLERVGAIKPKFELSEELKDEYGSFGDIPRPTRHKSEKDILDKFDIDIAKTCEEALHNIKANREVLLHLHNKAIEEKAKRYFEEKDPEEEYGSFEEFLKREREKNKRRFEPFSDRIFPLDKNGNGGC